MSIRIPKYRLHKGSGQALVQINRDRIYLGTYGSEESKEKYERLVAEWLSSGRQRVSPPIANPNAKVDLTVNELILAYWHFAESLLLQGGETDQGVDLHAGSDPPAPASCTATPSPASSAPRPSRPFGSTWSTKGSPEASSTVALAVSSGRSSGQWPRSWCRLRSSTGCRPWPAFASARRRHVKPSPCGPSPDLYVAVILPFVTPHVAAMVKLQRLSGMRASELVVMRPCGHRHRAETSGFTSRSTIRTAGGGTESRFRLGLKRRRSSSRSSAGTRRHSFLPRWKAEKWRLEHRPPYHGKERKTKIYPSELRQREKLKAARRQQRKPKRPKRDRYDTNSYRQAIEYGFKKAKKAGFVVPHWHPHQLRHNRGTEVRRKYGIEAAQVALGHAQGQHHRGLRREELGAGRGLPRRWDYQKRRRSGPPSVSTNQTMRRLSTNGSRFWLGRTSMATGST